MNDYYCTMSYQPFMSLDAQMFPGEYILPSNDAYNTSCYIYDSTSLFNQGCFPENLSAQIATLSSPIEYNIPCFPEPSLLTQPFAFTDSAMTSYFPTPSASSVSSSTPSLSPQPGSVLLDLGVFEDIYADGQVVKGARESKDKQLLLSPLLIFSTHTSRNEQDSKAIGKSYSCKYCSRSFARRYDVTRHSRIHTGAKPYICPCCSKGFARSDARIRHFRTEPKCQNGADRIKRQKHKKVKLEHI